MGIAQNPAFWIWLLFFLFILGFLIVMIVMLATGYSIPKESEQIYVFPNVTTNRHGTTSVEVYLKVRLKGGTKEEEIPPQSEYQTIVTFVLNDLVTSPSTTHWNILAQNIGKRVMDENKVQAVSVMLEIGTTDIERYIYTEGYISPLDKQ